MKSALVEMDRLHQEKDDLVTILMRHPEVFQINNLGTYLKKKMMKKSNTLVERQSTSMSPEEREKMFKSVKEFIQKAMDVYERRILDDFSGKEEAILMDDKDPRAELNNPLLHKNHGLTDTLRQLRTIGELKVKRPKK